MEPPMNADTRRSEEITPWHALSAPESAKRLATDLERGLSAKEASARLANHGPNELAEAPPEPIWKKFLEQFKELVIWILIAAAVVSGALGEWVDTVAILAIVLMNAILGFIQEERAGRALAALRKLSSPNARVVRGGTLSVIPARELVPGDVIEIEAGDHLSADARIVEEFGLRTQEAALTGESTPTDKDAAAAIPESAPLGDRKTMLYMGTVVAGGKGRAVVTGTGMNSELGRIAGLLERFEPEPTPLQRRLTELGKVLVYVCLAVVVVIFAMELWEAVRAGEAVGKAMADVFLIAVSLAVAAVPEGLPAVVTVALAIGLQRMVRRNALVRKLPSVETLGSVTVICTDKTGTLTRNEMTVQKILAGGRLYDVGGAGYIPQGEFREGDQKIDPNTRADLLLALKAGARCNNAKLVPGKNEQWEVIGDPTEGALLVSAMKAGIGPQAGDHIIYEIPFDSERKAMSVVLRDSSGAMVMFAKGAPEVMLGKCTRALIEGKEVTLDENLKKQILKTNTELASRALRVLGLAYAPLAKLDGPYEEKDLVFLGLTGMKDPPREEAKLAVAKCHEAGIRPIMITGDHPKTASAIAHELDIAHADDRVVTGQELDGWSDGDLAREVEHISVYARVTAEHKLRVIKAWKSHGQVVAMTGDGVNDAPAIQSADIGVAMGITGTDVTKSAADMVLTDDNFASIVNAVEEGRCIFDNIQRFVHYLLACNSGEVIFMFLAALLDWPAPMVAVQLLWINLVTDGLPALALGLEPPERDIMRRKPRPPREPVITWQRGLKMLGEGALFAMVLVIGFACVYKGPDDPVALRHARTTAFCIMAFSELFYALACRSQTRTLPELGLFSNPALLAAFALSVLLQLSVVTLPYAENVFETAAHLRSEWILIIVLSLTPVTVIEAGKLIRALIQQRRTNAPA